MRKFLALLGIVVVLALAGAPAALAQPEGARDPFLPLITPPDPAATAPGVPGVPTDPTVPVDPVDPVDPLPTTGASTQPWLGISYVLVAFGAGVVALSKVLGPTPVR